MGAHIDWLKALFGLDEDTGEAVVGGRRVDRRRFGNQRGSGKITGHSKSKARGRRHRRAARGRRFP